MSTKPSQPEVCRLTPTRSLPLLARLEPLPKELFRSFIARTARASSASYVQLARELGAKITKAAPSWFGVELTQEEAELLGVLLRHEPSTLLKMQLPVLRAVSPSSVTHPTRYRACAECQTEDQGWRWSTGDPLRVACRIHDTLLWNEGPDNQCLKDDFVFNNSHKWDWESLVQDSSSAAATLVELQTTLSNARYEHKGIDKRFQELIVSYRRALEFNPDADKLNYWCAEGWDLLSDLGRPRADLEQRTRSFKRESIWTRTEELAAIFPAAVPAVLDYYQGDTSLFDHMLDDLLNLGPAKAIDLYAATNSRGGVLLGRPLAA